MNIFSLADKVAVITGGGSAIGREIAVLFAQAGATVVVVGRDSAAMRETAALLAPYMDKPLAVAADHSDVGSLHDAVEVIASAFGRIDILVNVAGISTKSGALDVTPEEWDSIYNVNVKGTMFMSQAVLRKMVAADRGGRIINISSLSGTRVLIDGNSCYSSSKAAVNMLTQALAYEFSSQRITVNAILPGPIRRDGTGKEQAAGTYSGPVLQPGRLPMGIGEPSDIAAAALYFAGEASRHVTGQLLVVDGGFMLS